MLAAERPAAARMGACSPNFERKLEIAGPMRKPSPKLAPTIPKARERFLGSVTSDI